MSTHEEVYPQATPELAEQRTRLAPGPAEAFRAFSQIWVAAEMRAGGAYAHSALALDTIARRQTAIASLHRSATHVHEDHR